MLKSRKAKYRRKKKERKKKRKKTMRLEIVSRPNFDKQYIVFIVCIALQS